MLRRWLQSWLAPPPPPAIGAAELLGPVFEGQKNLAVGWPDDEVDLAIERPTRLQDGLRRRLALFRAVSPEVPVVVDLDLSDSRRSLVLRMVSVTDGPDGPRDAARELALRMELPIRAVGERIGHRQHHPPLDPPVESSDWEAHYRQKLARASWGALRAEAYRFCHLATRVAEWACEAGAARVLVPSVGLCAVPWLFAARGLAVTVTEISPTALGTVRHPDRLPLLYGAGAKVRWDIREAAIYGGSNPERFEGMPDLANAATVAELGRRIEWLEADWQALPIEADGIDVVFATNALPRGAAIERRRVTQEWARVVRPGGLVFCTMHNPPRETAGPTLSALGWEEIDALGDRASARVRTTARRYQDHSTSG